MRVLRSADTLVVVDRSRRKRMIIIAAAVIAGIGFAGYFLCIKQAGDGSVLWLAAISRAVSFLVTGAIVPVDGGAGA